MAKRLFPRTVVRRGDRRCHIVRVSTVEHSKPFAKSGENPNAASLTRKGTGRRVVVPGAFRWRNALRLLGRLLVPICLFQ